MVHGTAKLMDVSKKNGSGIIRVNTMSYMAIIQMATILLSMPAC